MLGERMFCNGVILSVTKWSRKISTFAFCAILLVFAACTDYEAQIDDEYEEWISSLSSERARSSSSVDLSSSDASCEYNAYANVFKDLRDGQCYKMVTIGSQTWMAENLNYETDSSYCYNDDVTYCTNYGRLYTWGAATIACPNGWHLPDTTEWNVLFDEAGGKGIAGKVLKSTSGWSKGENGTDIYSFTVFPTGYRGYEGEYSFENSINAFFWSSNEYSSYGATYIHISYNDTAWQGGDGKKFGFSVRCLQDNEKTSVSSTISQSSSSVVRYSSSSATLMLSSSEEVKPSSSGVVALSSSVMSSEMLKSSSSYDRTSVFNDELLRDGKYSKFVDPRNNREYYYIQIDGKDTAGKAASIKVMAENIDIGDSVWGNKDQNDDSRIERYCYDDDIINCDKYGGLYQWAEMMQLPSRCNTENCADLIKPNHQGICPDGWRLLTYNDYYIVVNADDNPDGLFGVRSESFGGTNLSGYSLLGTGYFWDYSFTEIENGSYWYYPEEVSEDGAKVSWQSRTATGELAAGWSRKSFGLSVRCVMIE